jgi:hypothetical protein
VIVVRSLAEAAAYCRLTGHAVLARRSPRPQAHVWECMWRDEPRQLVFVEQASEAPSSLIDRDGFVSVGADLLAAVPATPLGFVRGEARRCVADLLLAAWCFGEALRSGPDEALASARAAADARRSAWIAALPQLPEARALGEVPVPLHGFAPPPALARWLARPVPFPIDEIPAEFGVVARADDGRFLARHPSHALAWLTVNDAGLVTRIEALQGRAALAAVVDNGFTLLEVQRARLRACAQAGDPISLLLDEGLGEGRSRVILDFCSGGDRVRFLEVETRDPRFRGALLAVRIDDEERVLGLRIVEGLDGYEMMGVLDATAPHLPGPRGEPPVAQSAERLRESLEQVGQAVRPLLEALVDPARREGALASIRPREGDAARVFQGSAADLAALDARYARLWEADPPRVRAPAASVTLRIVVATAGMLLPDAPMAKAFPPSWARVAERLRPERTWVAWSYVPTGPGRANDYDGLVWIDDRWAWFPAPWRVLGLA